MPLCIVNTSVKVSAEVEKEMLQQIEQTVSSITGKPVSYVMVGFNQLSSLRFGGSDEPAAFCLLHSIGQINATNNKKLSNSISQILKEHLKVQPNRLFIQFYDSPAQNFGYNGGTF
eukprot:GHVS01005860.1.p1 GENE.GHVS01005860.1~~GHVS01005860.1.p1  ORF type:complete len:116 (+),score=15.96 GHVS01005860.1:168-515(+)